MTFGSGLADCYNFETDQSGLTASALSWPQHLAHFSDASLVNCSCPGSSSIDILYRIITYKFQADDQVIILWTYPDRTFIFNHFPNWICPVPGARPMECMPLGTWDFNLPSKRWLNAHSDQDNLAQYWYHVHHATSWLAMLNISLINLTLIRSPVPKFIDPPTLDLSIAFKSTDLALDNMHPGPKSHWIMANKIYNKYRDQLTQGCTQ
jgi:hypothetical protein